jgi:peptidoglycan/xylan/chitin deacetylase (PgdA/CDA1 family)
MPSLVPSVTAAEVSVRRRVAEPCSHVIGSVVSVATTAPEFVLTYDDGPCPDGTPAVLDALAAHHATATFFVLLGRTRLHPQLLAEVIAAGHEIGLHGPDHRRLSGFSPAEVEARIRHGRAELEDSTGQTIRWFRPPYGKQTVQHWHRVRACGMVSVSWGGDMADWRPVAQADRVRSALAAARRGEIILGHDGFAGPADGVDDGPPPIIDRGDLTQRLLVAYGERGLVGRSLGDALSHGTEVLRPWFRR